jgi:hypothetical protein
MKLAFGKEIRLFDHSKPSGSPPFEGGWQPSLSSPKTKKMTQTIITKLKNIIATSETAI